MKLTLALSLLSGPFIFAGCASRPAPAPPAAPAVVLQLAPPAPPAAAPFPQKWTTLHVVQAFKSAGLEAEKSFVMGHKDYGLGPMSADEGRRFLIPSLGPDNGGHIFTFSNAADLDTMRKWYVGLGKSSGAFFSYVYVRDNVLVQISGDLADAKAKKYQLALENMK